MLERLGIQCQKPTSKLELVDTNHKNDDLGLFIIGFDIPKRMGLVKMKILTNIFFFGDLSSKHGSGRDQALISLNDFQHSNETSLKTWNLGVYSEQTQQWIQLGIWNHLCVFSVAESTQKTMEMHMLQFPRRSEKYIRNLFFIMEIPKKIASRRVKRTPSTLH